MLIKFIKQKLKWRKHYKKWKDKNKHNFCEIQSFFNIDNVSIGRCSYGMINAHIYNNPNEKLQIGSFCSIAEDVHFVFAEHDYRRMCSYPFRDFVLKEQENDITKGPIVVEDDVWIGQGCIILSGVTIHQGAVIGAGYVVTCDIPAYAIYAGNKVIKYRFSPEVINKLLKVDYSKLTDEMIKDNIDILYSRFDESMFNNDFVRALLK